MDSTNLEAQRERKRLYARNRTRAFREAGLCTNCGKKEPAPPYRRCDDCRAALWERDQPRANARRENLRSAGLCIGCAIRPATNGQLCKVCSAAHKEDMDRRYKRLVEAGRCMFCGKPARPNLRTCQTCADNNTTWRRRNTETTRRRIMERYGGAVCACCGETIFSMLTIDHVNDDGAAHRRSLGGRNLSGAFYKWIEDNNYPPGFQILCYNCNIAKFRNGGTCPHRESPVTENLTATVLPIPTVSTG